MTTGTKETESVQTKAMKFIKARGGMVRSAEAIKAGIHSRTLRKLCHDGTLEQVRK